MGREFSWSAKQKRAVPLVFYLYCLHGSLGNTGFRSNTTVTTVIDKGLGGSACLSIVCGDPEFHAPCRQNIFFHVFWKFIPVCLSVGSYLHSHAIWWEMCVWTPFFLKEIEVSYYFLDYLMSQIYFTYYFLFQNSCCVDVYSALLGPLPGPPSLSFWCRSVLLPLSPSPSHSVTLSQLASSSLVC